RALTHGRVPARHLWPGAVAGGVATSAVAVWTVVFLPGIFERDAARYGVIGVALALVSWMLAIIGVTVVVGVGGADGLGAAGAGGSLGSGGGAAARPRVDGIRGAPGSLVPVGARCDEGGDALLGLGAELVAPLVDLEHRHAGGGHGDGEQRPGQPEQLGAEQG